MIFINQNLLCIPSAEERLMKSLTNQITGIGPASRSSFIDAQRYRTWRHINVLKALRDIVGNKCWYSEVYLEGADADVDHFRPKGKVREVDESLSATGQASDGYW